MPKRRINGVEIFFEEAGRGEPMVLVHGSWGDHHNWDPVVGELAKSFHVVTYDRRGHSQSERPAAQGSFREDAEDLAALIEALGLAPAHVVGNSGGSAISLRLATMRPELFRTLIVHEPALAALLAGDPAHGQILEGVKARIGAVAELLAAGDDAGGAERFVNTIAFGPGAWPTLPPELRATFVRNAPTFLDELRDPDASTVDLAALGRFTRPTLLTQGDDSAPMFPAICDVIAKAMPRAERRKLAGVGHVPHITHPALYVEMVTSFARAAGTAARAAT